MWRSFRRHPFRVAAVAAAAAIVHLVFLPIAYLNIERWAEAKDADKILVDWLTPSRIEIVMDFYANYIGPYLWPYLLGVATCAIVFGIQDLMTRRAAKALLVTLRPYVGLVSGRLKYANQACSGIKSVEDFCAKLAIQRIDMSAITSVDTGNLSDAQRAALEQLAIQCRELDQFVDYEIVNTERLTPHYIARLYRNRTRKLAQAVNQLIIQLAGRPVPSPELVQDIAVTADRDRF